MKYVLKTLPFLFLAVAAGCSTSASPDLDAIPNFDMNNEAVNHDTHFDTGELPATRVDESFQVAFLYMGRLGSKYAGRTDLFVMNSQSPEPENITGNLDWSCQDGCIMGPDFKILGVFKTVDKPDVLPSLRIYGLDKDMHPTDAPARVVESVKSARLARSGLYFMRKGACPKDPALQNAFCMYQIAKPLDPASPEKALFTFPGTTRDARNSVFSGNFRVAPDGSTLLLLLPTVYSQKVFIWHDGTLTQLGDEICHQVTAGGTCTGSGSEYSDRDPLGMSPDGSVVVAALLEQDRDLRLRKYKTEQPDAPVIFSTVYSTHSDAGVSGGFNQFKCIEKLRKPWQYTDILGDIRFTQDSESCVFIAGVGINCPNAEKPQTDIVSIPVDVIGKPIGPTSIRHITHNTNAGTPQDIRITDFTFSPSGKYMVFIGTPRLQTDGTPIPQGSPRHQTDHEIYFTSADGTTQPIQVTNSLDYMAVDVWTR